MSTLSEPVFEWRRFTIAEATRSRGSRGSENADPVDVDREVHGGIRRPQLVAQAEDVSLVACGFWLVLSEKVALLWARLRLETRSGHEIGSVFPELIVEPQAYAGQFGFDTDATIARALVERDTEGRGVAAFDPIVYAGRPSEHCCFWDFNPVNHSVPTGCDQLAFTLRGTAQPKPELIVRLMLAIVVAGIEDELYVEQQPLSWCVDASTGASR